MYIVLVWVSSLWSIAILNIFTLLQLVKKRKWKFDRNLICTSVYTLVCAFRSFLPRIDAERMCFFDTRLSYPFIGRSLATFAEICFAYQISRFWHDAITRRRSSRLFSPFIVRLVRDLAFYACVIAQAWCWAGVLTRNQLFHAVEESYWCFASAILTICTICVDGWRDRLGKIMITAGACFTLFMVWIDIPMYVKKSQGIQSQIPEISFYEGIYDSFSCAIVSRTYDDWKDEMIWLSGYFSLAVWASLYVGSIG